MRQGAGGEKAQQSFRNKPEMDPNLTFYFVAFWDMHGDRNTDFGAISFMAIDRYANRYGIDDVDEFDRFKVLIRALDNVYIKHQADQMPKASSEAVSADGQS